MNQTIIGFFKKEISQTLRNPRSRPILFVLPLVQMTLFGLAISNEIKNIKLGAVYDPGDRVFRRMTERCYGSGWFIQAKEPPDADPFHWVQSGRADVVLVAPAGGLTKNLERGRGRIQVIVDASHTLKARAIENYMRAITMRLAAENNSPAAASQSAPLLTLDTRILYNPEMKTAIFMVPGVMCMILCLLTIILTSSSLAREKEMGTFETLIASPAKPWEILLGKTLPYVFLAMLDLPLILGVAVIGFGVPLRGSLLVLTFSTLVFVCSTVSIGILISTFAENQQQAMMGGFLFMFPAIQLSGVMFPVENMPEALRLTAYLNPLKYFVDLMRNIMLKGGDPNLVAVNLGALALMAVVAGFAAYKRFHQTLN